MPPLDEVADLGPLPKTDHNAELQRSSFQKFKAVLPTDRFVFRDERTEDAGVDASLELLTKSGGTYGHTNLRSQVQLKGTDSGGVNSAARVSLQIKVSTLNYLLNGPSSVFILYVAPRNELRFAWAHDERKRLDGLNPEWMQQETVTIHFSEHLTPAAFDAIYDRILQQGRMQRKIQDTLATATMNEQVVVSIDPETLATTNPDEAAHLLLANGLTDCLSRVRDSRDGPNPPIENRRSPKPTNSIDPGICSAYCRPLSSGTGSFGASNARMGRVEVFRSGVLSLPT